MPNRVVRKIIRRGRREGQPRKYILAALATGRVESNFRNLRGGDADSEGWRQERASLYRNPRNLNASIDRFYREARQHDRGQSAGQLAADVQRPAAQYRGRYTDVLRTGEPQRLLRGGGGAGFAAASNLARTPGLASVRLGTRTRFDRAGYEQAQHRAFLANYLRKSGGFGTLFRTGVLTTTPPDPRDFTSSELTSKIIKAPGGKGVRGGSTTPSLGRHPMGRVAIAPTADRSGVPTKKGVVRFVSKVAGLMGASLTIGTGSNHSRMTTSGNVSDHWRGSAADVPLRGAALIKAGQDALIAAGMNPRKARKQTGGLYNVGQWQIIFNTHIGGDHTNHLHVGHHAR